MTKFEIRNNFELINLMVGALAAAFGLRISFEFRHSNFGFS